MSKLAFYTLICFFTIFGVFAKTLEQKKDELKKIYEAGGISKVEYEKAVEFLEKPNEDKDKEKAQKKFFSLTKKKKDTKILKKDKNLEKITSEKLDKLGEPVKFDNSYFTKSMLKKFKGCNNSFKCKGDKAGKELFLTFSKRSKAYQQKNPGDMIKAMAMFEIFYASKLWSKRDNLKRYKENKYNDDYYNLYFKKKRDEKEIRSLFGINKGRIAMREALGMTVETPAKEAIQKFWLLGEFLDLGTGVKNKKLGNDLKKRKKLLEDYKLKIANLKKKLQDDIDEDENDKTVE